MIDICWLIKTEIYEWYVDNNCSIGAAGSGRRGFCDGA